MDIDWSNLFNFVVFVSAGSFWRGFLNELDIFCYRCRWLPMGPIVR